MTRTLYDIAKRGAERALVGASTLLGVGRVSRDHALVLAYHNVVTDPSCEYGDGSLHLPLESFVRQVDLIARFADVVPLASLLSPVAVASPRPRVAITFDDAYAGAVRYALPFLAMRGIPATVFVAPGRLGGQYFWWDVVGMGVGAEGLDEAFRTRAIKDFGGRDEAILEEARRVGLPVQKPPVDAGTASEAELVAAAKDSDVLSYAAHTWSHVSVPHVPRTEALREIRSSLEWATEIGCHGLPLLALPYGSRDALTGRLAQEAGAAATFRIDGGWYEPRLADRTMLPRLNIPAGLSIDGFALRLRGFLDGRGK